MSSTRTNAPYVTTRQVTVAKDNGQSLAATVTAPAVDGYSFVCWCNVATIGDVGTPYIENATSTTTDIWDQACKGAKIEATALYQRS